MSDHSKHIGKKFRHYLVWYNRTEGDATHQKTFTYDDTALDAERAKNDAITLARACHFARIDHVEKTITYVLENGKLYG